VLIQSLTVILNHQQLLLSPTTPTSSDSIPIPVLSSVLSPQARAKLDKSVEDIDQSCQFRAQMLPPVRPSKEPGAEVRAMQKVASDTLWRLSHLNVIAIGVINGHRLDRMRGAGREACLAKQLKVGGECEGTSVMACPVRTCPIPRAWRIRGHELIISSLWLR
jgi:hypothetical protein